MKKALAYRNAAKEKENEARENVKKMMVDYLMSETEVRAQLGGICRQTIYSMLKNGRFPQPMRIGPKKYWRSTVVSLWLEEQQPLAA